MLLFLRLVPNRLLYFYILFNEAIDPELFKVNSLIIIYVAKR